MRMGAIGTRAGVVVMAVLLALYLAFAVSYGIVLIRVGTAVAIGLGVAMLVLPLIGAWALVIELRFGLAAERLAVRLERDGGLPDEQLPTLPSGRPERAAAAAVFDRYRTETEAAPDDWSAWFRLALAYDGCGDRRRARWATRRAIALARLSRAG